MMGGFLFWVFLSLLAVCSANNCFTGVEFPALKGNTLEVEENMTLPELPFKLRRRTCKETAHWLAVMADGKYLCQSLFSESKWTNNGQGSCGWTGEADSFVMKNVAVTGRHSRTWEWFVDKQKLQSIRLDVKIKQLPPTTTERQRNTDTAENKSPSSEAPSGASLPAPINKNQRLLKVVCNYEAPAASQKETETLLDKCRPEFADEPCRNSTVTVNRGENICIYFRTRSHTENMSKCCIGKLHGASPVNARDGTQYAHTRISPHDKDCSWYRSMSDLSDLTVTLSLTEVKAEDSGQWTLTLTDKTGASQGDFHVHVAVLADPKEETLVVKKQDRSHPADPRGLKVQTEPNCLDCLHVRVATCVAVTLGAVTAVAVTILCARRARRKRKNKIATGLSELWTASGPPAGRNNIGQTMNSSQLICTMRTYDNADEATNDDTAVGLITFRRAQIPNPIPDPPDGPQSGPSQDPRIPGHNVGSANSSSSGESNGRQWDPSQDYEPLDATFKKSVYQPGGNARVRVAATEPAIMETSDSVPATYTSFSVEGTEDKPGRGNDPGRRHTTNPSTASKTSRLPPRPPSLPVPNVPLRRPQVGQDNVNDLCTTLTLGNRPLPNTHTADKGQQLFKQSDATRETITTPTTTNNNNNSFVSYIEPESFARNSMSANYILPMPRLKDVRALYGHEVLGKSPNEAPYFALSYLEPTRLPVDM